MFPYTLWTTILQVWDRVTFLVCSRSWQVELIAMLTTIWHALKIVSSQNPSLGVTSMVRANFTKLCGMVKHILSFSIDGVFPEKESLVTWSRNKLLPQSSARARSLEKFIYFLKLQKGSPKSEIKCQCECFALPPDMNCLWTFCRILSVSLHRFHIFFSSSAKWLL